MIKRPKWYKEDNSIKLFKKLFNTKMDHFPGVVILGNNGASTNKTVAVWPMGAYLNNTNPEPTIWKTDGGGWNTTNDYVVRHNPIGEYIPMQKEAITELMKPGNKNFKLNGGRPGHRGYEDTAIGPVLYLTVDVDEVIWQEFVKAGIIDKKRIINLDVIFPNFDFTALNELSQEVIEEVA